MSPFVAMGDPGPRALLDEIGGYDFGECSSDPDHLQERCELRAIVDQQSSYAILRIPGIDRPGIHSAMTPFERGAIIATATGAGNPLIM